MIGTYKSFYKFVREINPYLIELWEDLNNRPNPKPGDMFEFTDPNIQDVEYSDMHTFPMKIGKFVKVEFDSNFENGVAFYYIFDCNGEIIKIHSINNVYDMSKLKMEEYVDLYKFWIYCKPIK